MLRPFCRNLSPAGCILQIVDQSIRYKSNLINQPPTRILEKRQRRTCAAEVPETGGFSTLAYAETSLALDGCGAESCFDSFSVGLDTKFYRNTTTVLL